MITAISIKKRGFQIIDHDTNGGRTHRDIDAIKLIEDQESGIAAVLQVTDEHFKRAASEVVQKAVQNTVQSRTEPHGSERNSSEGKTVQVSIVSDDATKLADVFLTFPDDSMGLEGFEPSTLRL